MSAVQEQTAQRHEGPAEPWLWLFILGDMSIFGLFFGCYLWAFGEDRAGFAALAESLITPLGLANTGILLTSSYVVVRAVQAQREDGRPRARRFLGWALALAGAFVAIKLSEYSIEMRRGHGLTTSTFFMYYFVLTGLHLGHVSVGSLLLEAWRRRLRSPSPPSLGWAQSVAGYWHMVDLLWVLIFSFLYIGTHA